MDPTRRLAVRPLVKGNKGGVAVAIGPEVSTMEDLRIKLASALQVVAVDAVFWKAKDEEEEGVEVTDVDFLRDGDTIYASVSPANKEEEKQQKTDGWVSLNVGGRRFLTCRSTVTMKVPDSMLARMLASEESGMSAGKRDEKGAIVIDRSPRYFEPILDYLRTGRLLLDDGVNPEGVYEEAKYYGVDALLSPLSALMSRRHSAPEESPLTRRDIVAIIAATPCSRELRFQGVNMANADLSRLDLRHINFKYASMKGCNLTGANLSSCSMERADLSHAILDGAQMLGVKMLCANLEAASLRGCNFDDPAGSYANMEGVNLRAAVMEGSNMARVNLRVATIKHGNLKNCDLRAAVLAGADLEFCDLSGSDLGEANLRGANLKDTTLELMQTPLHMSQTIR